MIANSLPAEAEKSFMGMPGFVVDFLSTSTPDCSCSSMV